MRAIVLGSVTSPITRSCPPQLGHTLIISANPRQNSGIPGGVRATLAFPILLDPEGEAFQTWRVRRLPKTFVINRRGRIVYEAEDGRDMGSEHIRERLEELTDE